MKMGNVLVSLDVGTMKTSIVVAEAIESGLVIRSFASVESSGVIRGSVVDIEKARKPIADAISQASRCAKLRLKQAIVTLGSPLMNSISMHSIADAPQKNSVFSHSHILSILEDARKISMPEGIRIIDCEISSLTIDGKPISGEIGRETFSRVEADIMVFVAKEAVIENLKSAVEKSGLEVIGCIPSSIAAAEALVAKEDRCSGVALLDIGAGKSDMIIFENMCPRYHVCVPFGGENVTHDIMVGLDVTHREAERLKLKYGCAMEKMIPKDAKIDVPNIHGSGKRAIEHRYLAAIMEARLEEIFALLKKKLQEKGVSLFGTGLNSKIIVSGGTAMTPGIVELVERVFNLKAEVRLAASGSNVPDAMKTHDYAVAFGAICVFLERLMTIRRIDATRSKIATMLTKVKNRLLQKL